MTTVSVSEARSKLYRLLDQVSDTHIPAMITGKRSNAVLVSEDLVKGQMQFLFLKMMGILFKRPYICYQFQICVSLLKMV
jgi:hypothetical protein